MDEPTPTTADLLGLATAAAVEFEGRTYELREPTLEERGRYQRWLEDELRAAHGRDQDTPDAARDRLEINKAIAAGLCEFDGELAVARRRTWSGQAKLFEVLFGLEPAAAERLVRQKAEEIAEAFRKAVIDADPKAAGALLAPLLRTLGLPPDFLSGPSSTSTARRPSKPSKGGRSRSSGRSTAGTAATGKRAS